MSASECTTHYVYRIVCFQTGKVYVGQTNNIKTRRRIHFSELKCGVHHNDYLQNSYNKWGAGAFYFEVLERNIRPDEINDREVYWIAHFDSFHNGYNATPGGTIGNGVIKSCTWNGIDYPSVNACAEACGIEASTMSTRLSKGYTCDADMVGTGQNQSNSYVSCAWNGIHYKSIKDCAIANGVHQVTMLNRIQNGYTCDDDMRRKYANTCTWNGIEYPSIRAASLEANVSPWLMQTWIDKGYTCDADVVSRKSPQKTCRWNGIEYPSLRKAAQANGTSHATLHSWLKRGYTSDIDTFTP